MSEDAKRTSPPPSAKHCFVDEAGDPVLFNARGKLIVGSEGCSRYFLLGMLDIPNPVALEAELGRLRARLLADNNSLLFGWCATSTTCANQPTDSLTRKRGRFGRNGLKKLPGI